MADDQRAKAQKMMKAEGYATGGMIRPERPHINRHMKAALTPQAPAAMAGVPTGVPAGVMPGAAPTTVPNAPQFKKGGKVKAYAKGGAVKKDVSMGMAKGGKVKNDNDADDAPKPRHMAQGGAAKQRLGEANKAGGPEKPARKFNFGGGVSIETKKDGKGPQGIASKKSKGKAGAGGG